MDTAEAEDAASRPSNHVEQEAPAAASRPVLPQDACSADPAIFETVHRFRALAKPRKVTCTTSSEAEAAAHRSLSHTGKQPSVDSLDGTDSVDDVTSTAEELSVSSLPVSERSSSGWSSGFDRSEGGRNSSSYSTDFLGTYEPAPNLQREVICRLEFVTARQTRAAVVFLYAMVVFSSTVLSVESNLKATAVHPNLWFKLNISFGSLCLAGLLTCMAIFAHRAFSAHRAHRHWTLRRGRMACIYITQAVLQLLNLVCWVAPNAYALAAGCHWYGRVINWFGCLRWTLWNTIFLTFWVQAHNNLPLKGGSAKGMVVLDAPWSTHWPKLIWWAVFQANIVFLRVHMYLTEDTQCMAEDTEIRIRSHWLVVSTYLLGVGAIVYVIAFLYCMYKGSKELRKMPYSEYRVANLAHQILMRSTLACVSYILLSTLLLWYININSVASYYFTWLGLAPSQIAMTSLAIQGAFWFMPYARNFHKHDPLLQVWLQQFAWTEDSKADSIAERQSYGNNTNILAEPMFCLETAIKTLYWAQLVYGFQEAPVAESPAHAQAAVATDAALLKTKWKPMEDCTIQGEAAQASGMGESYTLENAMSFYHLQHAQLFWEQSLDTKVLVAWSRHMILLAFRGTASLTNALADLKAWRQAHPPKRGHLLLRTQPLVHAGFQNSWRANGLHDKILEHVRKLVQGGRLDVTTLRVMVTGHSLGGALATLAAIDLQREFSFPHGNLQCYTFGAPRTGNHAFAREYEELVPDTWHLINNKDLVVRGAKFVTLYKRPGHRVLMNRRGDLVVRPSPLELRLQFKFGPLSGKGIRDHLLDSYIASIIQACRVQFTQRHAKGGREGAMRLLGDKKIHRFLKAAGFSDYKELVHSTECSTVSKELGVIVENQDLCIVPDVVRELRVQTASTHGAEAGCCERNDISGQANHGGDIEIGRI